ncbi:MAG: GNAT family N-acetyltransferase [Acidimicrobiia bacterium]
MSRRRLGVVLLVPEPVRAQIDPIRRALGDAQMERIPTHLTLVPPVNVREADLAQAIEIVRVAGAATRPFGVELGPVTTFLPDSPVLHLAVGGDLDALRELRERVFVPPLARKLARPFVPHVTLLDDGEPARIEAARLAFEDLRLSAVFEAVTLLEEQDRVWRPVTDARFAKPAIVGRGSLDLRLRRSVTPDPEAQAFLERNWLAHDAARFGGSTRWERNGFTIVAQREEIVVGVATGWTALGVGYLTELLVDPRCRGQGIGSHLLAAVEQLAREQACLRLALRTDRGSDAQGFYEARGWRVDAVVADWVGGYDFVELRRDVPS